MNEASFWTDRLRPALVADCQKLKLRHHFERVENAVAVGTPDVDYCVAGVAGKIELKFAPRHPVRQATPVLGRGNGLRRSQIVWTSRRTWAGGIVFIAIGTPEMTWVIDARGRSPVDLARLEALSAPGLGEISAWCGVHLVGSYLPLTLIDERPVGPEFQGRSVGP